MTAPKQDNTQELFINNIFIPQTVTFLSEGDFTNSIDIHFSAHDVHRFREQIPTD